MLVTIATPTFNRAHLLPRLYQSLCNQSCKDFEWLIVDDGSQDETESVVAGFIVEGKIDIRYVKKENGGKHTAVNLAAKEAKGELFFIVDSDDWLPSNSIEDVTKAYQKVSDNHDIAGVCGLDMYEDGTMIGNGLPKDEVIASPQDIRSRWKVIGDMKEVFRTSVIREFPFPEIPDEKFCSEALIWNRIGRRYRLCYFNKPIYTVEYQPDGLTAAITRARMFSPIATMMTYSEWFEDDIPLIQKIKMALNYWRFRYCSDKRNVKIASWGKLLAPFGFIFYLKDHIKLNIMSDYMAFFGLNKNNC